GTPYRGQQVGLGTAGRVLHTEKHEQERRSRPLRALPFEGEGLSERVLPQYVVGLEACSSPVRGGHSVVGPPFRGRLPYAHDLANSMCGPDCRSARKCRATLAPPQMTENA